MKKLTEEDRQARIAAAKVEAEKEAAFKAQLFKDLGIEDHPKKDILYRIAWEWGHAYGLHEVRTYAEDLVELIR